MAAPVNNYRNFEDVLERAREYCDLFGMILFDDRAQHKNIKSFCTSNFSWLDDLAATNRMILFLPIAGEDIGRAGTSRKGASGRNSDYRNCSLQIASDFQIPPNRLPAILFFTLEEGAKCVQHSATFQFEPDAFAGKADDGQKFLSDVFSAVSAARCNKERDELIIKLQTEIGRLSRARKMNPIKQWAKDYVIGLANLPLDITRMLAKAGIKTIAGAS